MKSERFLFFFKDKAHFRRFLCGMAIVANLTGLGLLFIPQAWAVTFSCTAAGTPTPGSNLFGQDSISNQVYDQNGNPYTITVPAANANSNPFAAAGVCQETLGIFGRVLCFFKASIGQIVSTMYCGFQQSLSGPLSIAIELFIVTTGVAIMTGMTNFTPREGIMVILKIAVIWAFAMNASWGIGIGYSFFMGLAEQGTNIILNSVGGAPPTGGAYLTQADKIFQSVFNLSSNALAVVTAGGSGGSGVSALGLPASLISSPGITQCLAWLFPLFLALFLYFPLVAGFIFGLITQYIMLYARALLGYLTSLVLISFLFILSPVFISFALFQTTRSMFEQWLKYLTSFSLQMIIVFAFLVLLDMIPIGDFFNEILSLIRANNTTQRHAGFLNPNSFCAICAYTINYTANITDAVPPVSCLPGTGIKPLTMLFTETDLVQIIVSQIIALWIIGDIMHDFLKRAPTLARDLAGRMPFAAVLGGSSEGMGGPVVDYLGLDDKGNGRPSLEGMLENMKNRIGGSQGFRKQIGNSFLGRAGPVLGAVAGVGLLNAALSRRNDSQLVGSNSVSDEVSGAASVAASGANAGAAGSLARMRARNEIYSSSTTQSGKDDNQSAAIKKGILRMPLLNARNFDYIASEMKSELARNDMNESYDDVQKALQTVERYKTSQTGDPEGLKNALALLKDANKAYLIRTTNLVESQQEIVRENLGLGPIRPPVPQEQPDRPNPDPQDTGEPKQQQSFEERQYEMEAAIAPEERMRDVLASAKEVEGQVPIEDSRKLIDDSINSLQLQINVQKYLASPEAAEKSQADLDKAIADLNHAQTAQGLDQVLRQLYVLQRSLA